MRLGGVLLVTLMAPLLPAGASALALERTWRVGIITPSEAAAGLIHRHTLPELARRGFGVGRNLVIEVRVGSQSKIPALAWDLVTTNPDVVIAASDPAIREAVSADPSVPVVMSFTGGDPVKAGHATS